MSTHKLTKSKGSLRLDAWYEVEGVEPMPHWNHKTKWLPTHVHVSLSIGKDFGPFLPSSNELTTENFLGENSPVQGINVHGVKIKQDGTPGLATVNEHYYSHASLPDWLDAIVKEILLGLSYA